MDQTRGSPPTIATDQRGGVALWTALALVLLGAVLGGAFVGIWVFSNVDARLLLADQPARITILDPLEVSGQVLDNLDITIDDTIHSAVPVNQMLSLPIPDTLKVMAEFDGEIPIELSVHVQDKIPLDQVLDLDATIEADLLGDVHKLPIRGKVPVKAEVPIDLTIPVKKNVRIAFKAPANVKILENLNVPLKTVIDADIPIKSSLSVPVKSLLRARVDFPKDPSNVVINYADLKIPLRTLRLELAEPGKPTP